MIKKLQITILLSLTVFLIFGCTQPSEPAEPQQLPPADTPVQEPEEVAQTGQESVDQVGAGISDISDIDSDLDDSALDDLDSVLEDIENI